MNLKFPLKLLFLLLVSSYCSCTEELVPEKSSSILKYQPYGWDFLNGFVEEAENNRQTCVAVFNGIQLVKLRGEDAEVEWRNDELMEIRNVISLTQGDYLVVGEQYLRENVSAIIMRVDSKGKTTYKSDINEKLLSSWPGYNERVVSAVSDGDGGAYLLCFMTSTVSNRTTRLLIHLNEKNSIDRITEVPYFINYLTNDTDFNLYMIGTTSPEGAATMELEAFGIDMDVLRTQDKISKRWIYDFVSLEPDWKWDFYFPFKFTYSDGSLFITKQRNTGIADLSSGIDFIELDPKTGMELKNFSIDIDFQVNNYDNQMYFENWIDESHMYVLHNFGDKSKLSILTRSGAIVSELYLSGLTGKGRAFDLTPYGDRMLLAGMASLSKGETRTPFTLFIDKKR